MNEKYINDQYTHSDRPNNRTSDFASAGVGAFCSLSFPFQEVMTMDDTKQIEAMTFDHMKRLSVGYRYDVLKVARICASY